MTQQLTAPAVVAIDKKHLVLFVIATVLLNTIVALSWALYHQKQNYNIMLNHQMNIAQLSRTHCKQHLQQNINGRRSKSKSSKSSKSAYDNLNANYDGNAYIIKGNIDSKGHKYYYCPGNPGYGSVKIGGASIPNKKWFSDEKEVQAAGWVHISQRS